MVEAYLRFVALEVRRAPRARSACGRSTRRSAGSTCSASVRTGDAVRRRARPRRAPRLGRGRGTPATSASRCRTRATGSDALLLAQGKAAISGARLVEAAYEITNADRSIGARLGGAIAKAVGSAAPAGRVRARFEGSAGQSFGAFLTAGVDLRLVGEANDYVGKAMCGGRIVVSPPAGDVGDPCLLGNTVLYGATGGELFCAGSAGERFAVRNSGAVAVVEGVGDHGCEYMTRGTVVVLGPHGRNLGAGMTGGEAFLLDPDERLVNDDLVALVPLERADRGAPRRAARASRAPDRLGPRRRRSSTTREDGRSARFRRLAPRSELVEREAAEEGRLTA